MSRTLGRVGVRASALAWGLVFGTAILGLACSKDNAIDASQTTQCGDNTLDCVPCGPGEYRCDGAVLNVCQADGQGFDAVLACATEALCVKGLPDGACAAPVCNTADTRCAGANMLVCAAGRDEVEITTCPSEASCTAGLAGRTCAAGECSVPSDCTGQDAECRKRTCTAGTCGWQNIAEGTVSTTQIDGDCKRRVCDESGGVTTEAQPSDAPEPKGECVVATCEGSTVKETWVPEGTGCSGKGVCDGTGNCVACLGGGTKCIGNTRHVCLVSGQWDSGTVCVGKACVAGECVGVCEPGALSCSGQTPRTCTSGGQWENSASCPFGCLDGQCTGTCVPMNTTCSGNTVLTCDASGAWPSAGAACGNLTCVDGACVPLPSCAGLAANCGPASNQICCASELIPAGEYPMGRSIGGTDSDGTGGDEELPEHSANISAFRLDLFEVSVGRFRRFVDAYPNSKPAEGGGANPNVPGSGWKGEWNTALPLDKDALMAALKCDATYGTWRDVGTFGGDNHPLNCVTWYEAFAFCAWDGGWLPTEAEWEKAAAGGDENRRYPWGPEAPDSTRASYGCLGHGSSNCSNEDILEVGSKPLGVGRWGHYDLAGNLYEWVLDEYSGSWYVGAGNVCNNCANLVTVGRRGLRGGDWFSGVNYLRAAFRYDDFPYYRYRSNGFRCARKPQ